jgi:hypothetical protein
MGDWANGDVQRHVSAIDLAAKGKYLSAKRVILHKLFAIWLVN